MIHAIERGAVPADPLGGKAAQQPENLMKKMLSALCLAALAAPFAAIAAPVELFFSEYQKVNNPKAPDKALLFPFKHETLSDGSLTMERNYMEVRLNSGLSDAIFGRPPGELWTGRVESDKKEDDKGGETPKKDKEPPWKDRKRIVPKGAETPPAGEAAPPPKPEGG